MLNKFLFIGGHADGRRIDMDARESGKQHIIPRMRYGTAASSSEEASLAMPEDHQDIAYSKGSFRLFNGKEFTFYYLTSMRLQDAVQRLFDCYHK